MKDEDKSKAALRFLLHRITTGSCEKTLRENMQAGSEGFQEWKDLIPLLSQPKTLNEIELRVQIIGRVLLSSVEEEQDTEALA